MKIINRIKLEFSYDDTIEEGRTILEVPDKAAYSEILQATTRLLSHVMGGLAVEEDTPGSKEYNDKIVDTLNAMPLAVVMGAIIEIYESASDGQISLEPIHRLVHAHCDLLQEITTMIGPSEDDDQPEVSNGNSAVAIH